ncbi:MAG: SRPBCC family protein [Actinomycetota bacterium]
MKVEQLDDTNLHWVTDIGGQHREWDARITEQLPDERIAWHSEGDTDNAGVVTFHRIDDGTTRLMLQLEYYPDDIIETAGDKLGIVSHRVEGDLKRFKEFIESRGKATGTWRGSA